MLDGTPTDIIHRYEKIPTSVFEVESDGVMYVADQVVRAIRMHEASASSVCSRSDSPRARPP